MKLVVCNGRTLEVRDVGPVILRMEAAGTPLKCGPRGPWSIMTDEEARAMIREIRALEIYRYMVMKNG